jgi:hypothetical protein
MIVAMILAATLAHPLLARAGEPVVDDPAQPAASPSDAAIRRADSVPQPRSRPWP